MKRIIPFLFIGSLLLTACNIIGSNSKGPSFEGWRFYSEREFPINCKEETFYATLSFSNPDQNEIISITINDQVYPYTTFVTGQNDELYSDNKQITVLLNIPKTLGVFNYELLSFKYLDGNSTKTKKNKNNKPLKVTIFEPNEDPINKLMICHSFESNKGGLYLEEAINTYVHSYNSNITIEYLRASEVQHNDLIGALESMALEDNRIKAIVVDIPILFEYPYIENINIFDELTAETINSINSNLWNVSKDDHGKYSFIPFYWMAEMVCVNKSELSSFYGDDYETKIDSFKNYNTFISEIGSSLYQNFQKDIYSYYYGLIQNYLKNKNIDMPLEYSEDNVDFVSDVLANLYPTVSIKGMSPNHYSINNFLQQNVLFYEYNSYLTDEIEQSTTFNLDFISPSFGNFYNGALSGIQYLNIGGINEYTPTYEVDKLAIGIINNVLMSSSFQATFFSKTFSCFIPSNSDAALSIANTTYCISRKRAIRNNLASKIYIEKNPNAIVIAMSLYSAMYHMKNNSENERIKAAKEYFGIISSYL